MRSSYHGRRRFCTVHSQHMQKKSKKLLSQQQVVSSQQSLLFQTFKSASSGQKGQHDVTSYDFYKKSTHTKQMNCCVWYVLARASWHSQIFVNSEVHVRHIEQVYTSQASISSRESGITQQTNRTGRGREVTSRRTSIPCLYLLYWSYLLTDRVLTDIKSIKRTRRGREVSLRWTSIPCLYLLYWSYLLTDRVLADIVPLPLALWRFAHKPLTTLLE